MSLKAPLDLESLLAPISEDKPGGESTPYQVISHQFKEMRTEIDPNDWAEDDPRRPKEPKYADWVGIQDLASETLRTKAKDLRIACNLVEARLKRDHFAGLLEGLRLVRGLVEKHWEHLYPVIEDGDVSARAQPLTNLLDDPTKGLWLPTSVRKTPLVSTDEKPRYSYDDWIKAQKEETSDFAKDVNKAIKKAFEAAERSAVVDQCVEELQGLVTALEGHLSSEAPSFRQLRMALEDCQGFAHHVRDENQPVCPPEGSEGNMSIDGQSAQGGTLSVGAGVSGAIASRADAYRRLKEVADVLEQIEPHSPIPWLIRHAVELGEMPFPRLIKALIDDANQVFQINRKLGIKEEEPGSGG
jgi:type VI secretion system protein ImpA